MTLAVYQPLATRRGRMRYRVVVRVYAAGLYLAGRATTPEAVLALAGPKRLHVMMQRDIDADELGRLFTRGMQANTPRGMFARSIPGTVRIGEIFAARRQLRQGDSFSVDFVPGEGTQVRVNHAPQGAHAAVGPCPAPGGVGAVQRPAVAPLRRSGRKTPTRRGDQQMLSTWRLCW
jgi:hypothetical protein